MNQHLPKIEILLSPGCAHAEEAVSLVKKTLAELNIDAEISEIMLESDEKAREQKFLGSPTVRVDGRDIDPSAEGRQDYGLG